MNFMESMIDTNNNTKKLTANGAIGYATTGQKFLDATFNLSSMRMWSDKEIEDTFIKLFYTDRTLAIKWLFYIRDVREGMGERHTFRVCMNWLANNHKRETIAVLDLITEYGRWDDLICLYNTPVKRDVVAIIKAQLERDVATRDGQPISLLAKWLPSVNTSSDSTRALARSLAKSLKMSERNYRKTVSALRKKLKVVETFMSAKDWSNIDYSAVPSKANLIYRYAFIRHDEYRRVEFLHNVQFNKVKINSSVLFPSDIVNRYTSLEGYDRCVLDEDATLEELWKALPDTVKGDGSTLCVMDGSGSMLDSVARTSCTCADVANALAIYFAERCSGEFKNKFITFSEHPTFIDLTNAESLKEKLELTIAYSEVANTNIEATFDLILRTAVEHRMTQDEMPKNILILSDMEFDQCVSKRGANLELLSSCTLFETLGKRFNDAGYQLPRLIFWNICSKSGAIPVKENKLGVTLVSGFSTNIMKMVLSGELDPLACLLSQINSERYLDIEFALLNMDRTKRDVGGTPKSNNHRPTKFNNHRPTKFNSSSGKRGTKAKNYQGFPKS